LRYPADVFPYAAGVSPAIDVDHTIPYLSPDRGRPPGQPGSATSDPSCAAITGSELTVDGRSANPNPAPGYGDHLAIASHLPGQRRRHPSPRRLRIRSVNLGSRGEPATETGEPTCLAASEFADNL
jgi:hypothetical protein